VRPNRRGKSFLQDRQRKNVKEDRVKIVPGPANEIKWIREIFRLFTEERRSSAYIANYLNERGAQKREDRGIIGTF
jgi:hypothetical protein